MQQHASVSQGLICSDNCTCSHTEREVVAQIFYLTQSQYTGTGPTSPSADLITAGAWQGSHWSAHFYVTGMTGQKSPCCERKSNPGSSALGADALIIRPTRRSKWGARERKRERERGGGGGGVRGASNQTEIPLSPPPPPPLPSPKKKKKKKKSEKKEGKKERKAKRDPEEKTEDSGYSRNRAITLEKRQQTNKRTKQKEKENINKNDKRKNN